MINVSFNTIYNNSMCHSEVHVEPHKKQLHVTLAYNFPTDHLPSLEKLAKGIEVKLGCDWLAVLFSRDIRFANHEVICYSRLYCRFQGYIYLFTSSIRTY